MKTTLLYAALSMALATPAVIGKSELETLRELCAEQERQIKQLEEENSRLQGVPKDTPVANVNESLAKPTVASAPVAPAEAPALAPAKTHEIKQGETYYSIAKIYGISSAELAAANPKVKASALRPGQLLTLVAGAKKSSPTIAKPLAAAAAPPVSEAKLPPATPTVSPAPEKPQPSPSPEKKIRAVSVENKMTYGEFATQYGTNPERLNELNGLDLTAATVLAKGSELYVPAQP